MNARRRLFADRRSGKLLAGVILALAITGCGGLRGGPGANSAASQTPVATPTPVGTYLPTVPDSVFDRNNFRLTPPSDSEAQSATVSKQQAVLAADGQAQALGVGPAHSSVLAVVSRTHQVGDPQAPQLQWVVDISAPADVPYTSPNGATQRRYVVCFVDARSGQVVGFTYSGGTGPLVP